VSDASQADPELANPLRPPRHPVDQRCLLWWRLHALMVVAPLVLVGAVVALGTGSPWAIAGLVATTVLGALYVAAMPRIRFRIHRWEITDEAVYTKTGWLTQEWRVAPLSRIQTVDSVRGPLQQALGLSTVTVTTASAAGALAIVALDADLADQVVHHLTTRTQATPEDGT
jgi:membrane protein YdbS with pleckstrin-like domain